MGIFAGSASRLYERELVGIERVSKVWRTVEDVDAQYGRRSSRLYASGRYLFVVLLQALERDGDADAVRCKCRVDVESLRLLWRDDCRGWNSRRIVSLGREELFV